MVSKMKDGSIYFESNNCVRIFLGSNCEIHEIELKEEGITRMPQWVKQDPKKIEGLLEDGLKYRKIIEAKKYMLTQKD